MKESPRYPGKLSYARSQNSIGSHRRRRKEAEGQGYSEGRHWENGGEWTLGEGVLKKALEGQNPTTKGITNHDNHTFL